MKKATKAMKQQKGHRPRATTTPATRLDQLESMATRGEGIERVIALATLVLADQLASLVNAIWEGYR